MSAVIEKPWQLSLPLDRARVGEAVFCPLEPSPTNDALFPEWECPLLWKWVSSRLKIDDAFEGKPALRFNFARRTPEEVWKTNWTLWYDTGVVTREDPPEDITLRARLTFEELTCGYGSDNNRFVRPWTGIVARMVDLRRYYYLCLEYPDTIALYRREDSNWTCLARRSCDIEPFEASTIELRLRGQRMEGYLDGERMFAVTDYAYRNGKAGLRANTESFVTDFSIQAEDKAVHRFNIAREKAARDLDAARDRIPSAEADEVVTFPEEVPAINMAVGKLSSTGEPQVFYTLDGSPDGATGVVRTLNGEEVWRSKGDRLLRYHVMEPGADGLADIIGVSGSGIYRVSGKTGEVLSERRFSDLPTAPKKMAFLPNTRADLAGRGEPCDFLFTTGCNDPRIWALGPEFEDLWLCEAASGMGHNNQVCALDIDGDGREEVFAGGSLIDADGQEIWRQEELLRRLKAPNAGHVDAAQMGFFGEDPDVPVIHMEGSSAGHLVADARDGSTIIEHEQGHVQGGCAGRFVPGEPGIQVAASCRHGNYGILAVYSGDGRLLSRFQPDYRTDTPHSINWDGSGTELLLIPNDPLKAGMFDWTGRCLVPLSEFMPGSFNANMQAAGRDFSVHPLGDDPRDCLFIRVFNEMRIIRPSGTPPERCYRPVRRSSVSLPGWVERA